LEYLLRVRKWNPYCLRHSAITDDSDHLPEYALKKKVRWVMNSQQGKRYIKPRMGDELKQKILEHSGIKITNKQIRMVSRPCGSCGYVNKLESKFCENPANGCHYPQTQLALDEIKAAEQAKVQKLVNEQMESKSQEIYGLKERMDMMGEKMDRLGDMIMELDPSLIYYRHEQSGGFYTCKYDHPLTDEERARLTLSDQQRKGLEEKLKAMPPKA